MARGLLAHIDNSVARGGVVGSTRHRFYSVAKLGGLLIASILAGCASKPVMHTQLVEKPFPVYCRVQMPTECKDAYAVDRVSPSDDAITINRAMRIELEERASCEIKLRAAMKGCGK